MELRKTLFADDATFITDGSEKSFTNLITTLDNFSYVSGLKINSTKCNVLRIGSMRATNIEYLKHRNFNWKSEKAKVLGVTFHTNSKELIKENFDKCYKNSKPF